jgi:hypothetical protein
MNISAERVISGVSDQGSRIDRVRLEVARVLDRLGEVAIERLTPGLGGRIGRQRRQETASHDVDADLPRLIALNEGADLLTGSDQKCPLRGHQAGPARMQDEPNEQVAQQEQHSQGRDIEQDEPAARVHDRDLGQEGQHQQAQARDVPMPPSQAKMRAQGQEARQAILFEQHVQNDEDRRRQRADIEEGEDFADFAVDREVIGDAGEARHRDDDGDVAEQDRRRQHVPDDGGPYPGQPACVRSGRQDVIRDRAHGCSASSRLT